MRVIKYRIALFSENPDKLVKFYVGILGFKQVVKIDNTTDYGYGIEAAHGYKLWVARHSEIKNKSKEPFRILLSFYVDNIEDYFSTLKTLSPRTKIIEEPHLAYNQSKGEERYVGAFLDPDGNCIQLMQLTGN